MSQGRIERSLVRGAVAAFAALLLGGCASLDPAVQAARMEQEVERMIAVYGPGCEKLGYQKDTDPWRNCILRLNDNQERERYETRASMTNCWGHRGFFHCTSF